MSEKLLEIRDLKTVFNTYEGVVPAVDGVSLHIDSSEILGIVGESGCGKSVTALSIMRLIPIPPGHIEAGEVRFEGKDLLAKSEAEMRSVRGRDISMVFQEPMTSLNPVYTVGDQIAEAIQLHQKVNRRTAMDYAVDWLRTVAIPLPERRADEYPHQMSGGMRQRVMIAMALSCNPKLLIADEPTSALDVTVQAQILELMKKLRRELNMAIMFITHDLAVVAEMAERVIVMYAGRIVEEAPVVPLFKQPFHPYPQGLLESIPFIPQPGEDERRLRTIEGVVPNPLDMSGGCRFNPRCTYARERCSVEEPPLTQVSLGRKVRCWYPLTGAKERHVS
jgi:oligopeptide/dipeptide ABC transporter ATP-binding protein